MTWEETVAQVWDESTAKHGDVTPHEQVAAFLAEFGVFERTEITDPDDPRLVDGAKFEVIDPAGWSKCLTLNAGPHSIRHRVKDPDWRVYLLTDPRTPKPTMWDLAAKAVEAKDEAALRALLPPETVSTVEEIEALPVGTHTVITIKFASIKEQS